MSCQKRFVVTMGPSEYWDLSIDHLQVKNFIESNNIRYPTIVSSGSNGSLSEVMSNSELAACKGNARSLISRLREKGIMQQKAASPSL